ncbi:MAG: rhodanese-like domain-containing protein [Candidatus Thermoplasmatota archaeon]
MPVLAVEPRRARELVERQNALIVDVREPDEWADARIPGALHIPLGQIEARVGEIPRDRPVILQCRSGNRSAGATRALLELGFTNVHNLEGGIGDWAADGLPMEYGGE